MADKTQIEWTDATWNPITGCKIVSPGCTNCYAMKIAGTRLQHHPSRKGLTINTNGGPVWTGEVRFNEKWLTQPLEWKRPRRIFVCAHGDLFAENVPDEWIDQIFAIMALSAQHTFQVLTKRPMRMQQYCSGNWQSRIIPHVRRLGKIPEGTGFTLKTRDFALPNAWLGISVEDQQRANERIPLLLATPAAIRWVSAEPLLGPVDLTNITIDGESYVNALEPALWETEISNWSGTEAEWQASFLDWYNLDEMPADGPMHNRIDWIIAGGESGHAARPMHPEWARSLRDQCETANIPFLFKQWGTWSPNQGTREPVYLERDGTRHKLAPASIEGVQLMHPIGKRIAGRQLDSIEHNEFPKVVL